MNSYIQFLQSGSAINTPQSANEIDQIAEALKQKPQEILQQLMSQGEEGQKLLQAVMEAHPELQQMLEKIISQAEDGEKIEPKMTRADISNLYKCGGKVKKGQKGLPIPTKKVGKKAKGGDCPCLVKKIGGKLFEVNSCTGEIVKQQRGGLIFNRKVPNTWTLENMGLGSPRPYDGTPPLKFKYNTIASKEAFEPEKKSVNVEELSDALDTIGTAIKKKEESKLRYAKQLNYYKRFSAEEIKGLQSQLSMLGYDVGKIDGKVGPKTIQAVESFQRASGLMEDGMLGNTTLRALESQNMPQYAQVPSSKELLFATESAAIPNIRISRYGGKLN